MARGANCALKYANMQNKTLSASQRRRLIESLRKALRAKSVTQMELSAALSVSQSQISRVLAGKFKRYAGNARRICDYVDVKLEARNPQKGLDPRLEEALTELWDGTDRQADALVRLLRAVNALTRD